MDQLEFTLTPHTVYMMVGPSGSGKTSLCNYIHRTLQMPDRMNHHNGKHKPSSVVISSDTIRASMLSNMYNPDPHVPRMLEVSSQAFNILFTQLEECMAFPVNIEHIFVDTTGLNTKFREDVAALARKANYRIEMVLFDFTQSQYKRIAKDENHYQLIMGQMKKFKTGVLPQLNSRLYDKIIRVKHRLILHPMHVQSKEALENFQPDLKLIYGGDRYDACIKYDIQKPLAIIGDIHESTEALAKMMGLLGDKYQIVLLGDYIDKGNDTGATFALIKQLYTAGAFILAANHEAYIVRRLRGQIDPDPILEAKYFQSLKYFQDHPEDCEIFYEIYDASYPFLKFSFETQRTIFCTHAPCLNSVLGKLSSFAEKAQRNFRHSRETGDIRDSFKFVYEEAVGNHPLHFFGHISHKSKVPHFRNKVFLDTGAVYGNKLTAAVFDENGFFKYIQVDSKELAKAELQDNITKMDGPPGEFSLSKYDLDDHDLRVINRLHKSGINYISGTMAPAPSLYGTRAEGKADDLESLMAGLRWFYDAGARTLAAQPKFMGSRCQIYLEQNLEKCYATSRAGHKIEWSDDVKAVIAEQHTLWMTHSGWDSLLLDGELLPWSLLGKGLIDKTFEPYAKSVEYELNELDGDEMFKSFGLLDIPRRKELLASFNQQMQLHGGEVSDTLKPHFIPFNILTVNGEIFPDQDPTGIWQILKAYQGDLSERLKDVVGETYRAIDLDKIFGVEGQNPWDSEEYLMILSFFRNLTTTLGMEGIVLKPIAHKFFSADELEKIPPYMKVRNENYLQLVYGYDYKERYLELCQRKSIGGKVKTSIKEFDLGNKLLIAPPERRLEYITKLTVAIKSEASLDPRL